MCPLQNLSAIRFRTRRVNRHLGEMVRAVATIDRLPTWNTWGLHHRRSIVTGCRVLGQLSRSVAKQVAEAADIFVPLGETPGLGQTAVAVYRVIDAFRQPLPKL